MIRLPLKGIKDSEDSEWSMPMGFELQLRDTYCNLPEEMAKARMWLIANPQRRPTARGIRRFVVNWMNRDPRLLRRISSRTDSYRDPSSGVDPQRCDRSVVARAIDTIRVMLRRRKE